MGGCLVLLENVKKNFKESKHLLNIGRELAIHYHMGKRSIAEDNAVSLFTSFLENPETIETDIKAPGSKFQVI